MVNAIITANARQALLSIGLTLVFVELIHNCIGYGVGYAGAGVSGCDNATPPPWPCGPVFATAYDVLHSAPAALASVVFGTVQNASGGLLASFFRRRLTAYR